MAALHSLRSILLGKSNRQRIRVLQCLLGMPALLLIQLLLITEWCARRLDGATVACFCSSTLAGCLIFYALVRWGHSEAWGIEPSLSAPQMIFAMCCVGWGYALAGPLRAALLCLLPLILCFGIFALGSKSAKNLYYFGIALMGAVMAWQVVAKPAEHNATQEAANWLFVTTSMSLMCILSGRMARMRARMIAQKEQLAGALERIHRLAMLDDLTGLINRRAAQQELGRAAALAQRGARPLAVAMADLDNFKSINDSYGHLIGDRVLQAFANAAELWLRAGDQVARWGGEEFLFLLPDTDLQQARVGLDRLHVVFGALKVDGIPAPRRLSFSAGIALCSGPDDMEAAIERADHAMYRAKLEGRGRVHIWTPSDQAGVRGAGPIGG